MEKKKKIHTSHSLEKELES